MDESFVLQAEWHYLRGLPREALRVAREGLVHCPDSPMLWEAVAVCSTTLGDHLTAVEAWQQVLERRPQAAEVCNELGAALLHVERYGEAETVLRRGLALAPDDAALLANCGLACEGLGRWAEAEALQRRAALLEPEAAEVLRNLAGIVERNGQTEEALALYARAIALAPDDPVGHANLGVLLADLGRFREAEDSLRQALALQPDYQHGRMNLGQLLLRLGCYEEGWLLHEGRHYIHRRLLDAPTSCPPWQGESLAGRRILVLPEQGFGDQIQFCRYLSWLKAQGAARVSLVCPPELRRLFATLAGVDRLLTPAEAQAALPGEDCWTFLMSLPALAQTTLATIPAAVPYLASPPGAAPLPTTGCLRVGLVWRGNPRHSNDRERSLPGLEALQALRALGGVEFFSLQLGAEAAVWPDGEPLRDLVAGIGDFADTAALLQQLDLLVSVDTAVAHLAGALGRPCWLLLPHYKCDWRWLCEREDSPWYPTLRLFRQPRRGDWATPVARMATSLAAFASAHAKSCQA